MKTQDEGLNNEDILKSLINTYFNSPTSSVIVTIKDLICDYEFYEYPITPNQMLQFFNEIAEKGKDLFYLQKPAGRLVRVNVDKMEILVQLQITPMF